MSKAMANEDTLEDRTLQTWEKQLSDVVFYAFHRFLQLTNAAGEIMRQLSYQSSCQSTPTVRQLLFSSFPAMKSSVFMQKYKKHL